MSVWCVLCALCVSAAWRCVAGGGDGGGSMAGVPLVSPAGRYALDTTLQLLEAGRADRELGYRIHGELRVEERARDTSDPMDLWLQFTLLSPRLELRGRRASAVFAHHASLWDAAGGEAGDAQFYARWSRGRVGDVLVSPRDHLDVINYKKSLVSLFQFQTADGELNETDISGACDVYYEYISSHVFRKIKRRCIWASGEDHEGGDGDEAGAEGVEGVEARRVTRYELTAARDGLAALHAEEVVAVQRAGTGVKARVWTQLRRLSSTAPPTPPAALSSTPPADLPVRRLQLEAPPAGTADDNATLFDDDKLGLVGLVNEMRDAVRGLGAAGADGAGRGGDAGSARAALRLVAALRRAARAELAALFDHVDAELREGVCVLLGAAGTRAAHAVASGKLQLQAAEQPAPRLALAYLAGLALAHAPHEHVVAAALAAGQEAGGGAGPVSDAALLAAAAASGRAEPAARRHTLQLAVGDALRNALARCKDDDCRSVKLRALGNMRRADVAEIALEHAEREGGARAALAALDALEASEPAPSPLPYARRLRLARLALDRVARRPLEVRAAALDLLVRHAVLVPTELARLALELNTRRLHPELHRVFWQRAHALAAEHPEVQQALSRFPRQLTTWDALAVAGASSVLQRGGVWGSSGEAGGWRAGVHSLQAAAGGVLRRGVVRLLAAHPQHSTVLPALEVELWTQGLDTMMGDGTGGDYDDGRGDDETARTGLGFGVGGFRIRDIVLFDGQSELMSHVWAGSGSEPTPALRALHPLQAVSVRLPLIAGVMLHATAFTAVHYALDAQAQVSLWSRTARAELQERAGAAVEVRAGVVTAWGAVRTRSLGTAQARLTVAADLDFYNGVSLCVRAVTDHTEYRRNVTQFSELGDAPLRVWRRSEWRVVAPGSTLSLGRQNDQACRALAAA